MTSRRNNNSGLRLNPELKKAVMSSDEYDDYIILVQFLTGQRSLLYSRLERITGMLNEFELNGGIIKNDGNVTTIEFNTLCYTVEYRDDGSVGKYTVENPDNSVAVDWIHRIFFAAYIRPIYADKIDGLNEQLRDIDNDNVLKGIGEIRRSLRGDRYLTTAAISGASIQSEDDVDPFGIFGDD